MRPSVSPLSADFGNQQPGSHSTVTLMASNAGNYFVRPDAGQLNTIFTAIAADISNGASRLVDDGWN